LEKLGFPAAYRAIMAEALNRFPPASGPLAAIDLGSGDGAFAEALVGHLGKRLSLTLLDPSPAILKAAAAQLGPGRARLVVGDLDRAPAAENGYDVVIAAHLLEHPPEPVAALAPMVGLLRPGGLLVLSVSRPHWCSRLVWLSWRHRRFHETEMRALLQTAGLTEVQSWQPPAGPPRRSSLAYAARCGPAKGSEPA
jgi:ubiquinone/menaquinone biosynthesis C-methylase UbiE